MRQQGCAVVNVHAVHCDAESPVDRKRGARTHIAVAGSVADFASLRAPQDLIDEALFNE